MTLTPLQLELTRLIGKKEHDYGMPVIMPDGSIEHVINRCATLTDFHKWMNDKNVEFTQENNYIYPEYYSRIPYNSSLPLLEQETSTLEQIRDLIINNS